mgnify:CR=1 FL=1
MGLESPSSRAERNARLLSIWGRIPAASEAVAKIDAVETIFRSEPGHVVIRSQVLNQQREVVMTMEGWGMFRRRHAATAAGAP